MLMRKIVYIFLATESIDTPLLEACSLHSSLVEPIGEQDLLLDLSSFNRIGDVLTLLVGTVSSLVKGKAGIGIAVSPLLARLAVQRRTFTVEARSSCRSFPRQDIDIIQVIPGRESLFMSTLPLAEFTPLSPRECKLLKRLGYTHVGDLADLGPARLKQLLKRDASMLWHNIRGRDYSPVRGLYPPERLGYSLSWEEECKDYTQLRLILKAASRELGQLLEQRHAGCHHVEIHLEMSEGKTLVTERQLSSACHDSSRLMMILEGLMSDMITIPVSGLRVFLKDLKPVEMRSPDLFTLRFTYQEEAKQQKRAASMEQLLQRFPGRIGLGINIERREKILLFWDPWRFSPEGWQE